MMRLKRLCIFHFLLLFMLGHAAFAQDFDYHRDFELILSQTKDKNSGLYYPALLQRFNRNDSTLSHAEVLALQIGFTASQHYEPYKTVENERQILQLVQQKNYEDALLACNQLLKTNPLNLTALLEKSFVYWKLNHDSLDFHRDKSFKIVDAISSSGDGSLERPFFVLNPMDGQVLIEYLWGGTVGMMGSSRDKQGNFLDMLEFQKEGKEPQLLHFHLAHATAKMFSDEKKAQMEDLFQDNDILSKKKKTKQ